MEALRRRALRKFGNRRLMIFTESTTLTAWKSGKSVHNFTGGFRPLTTRSSTLRMSVVCRAARTTVSDLIRYPKYVVLLGRSLVCRGPVTSATTLDFKETGAIAQPQYVGLLREDKSGKGHSATDREMIEIAYCLALAILYILYS